MRSCPSGHESETPASAPEPSFQLSLRDIATTAVICGTKFLNASDFFTHLIPRCRGEIGMRTNQGSTPLHQLPPEICPHANCLLETTLTSVLTSWPTFFHVIPESRAATKPFFDNNPPVAFGQGFSFKDESGAEIVYRLTGRVQHLDGNHFISQLNLGDHAFEYNDMNNHGRLSDIGPSSFFDTSTRETTLLVFCRVSSQKVRPLK